MAPLDVLIIGGCGHVGLPLGISLAHAGLTVELYDTDPRRVAEVRAGEMPFVEFGAAELLRETLGKTLFVGDDLTRVADARHVIVTIGTPIDEYLNPRYGEFFEFIATLAPHLHSGQSLILRSTVFPGTTRELDRRLRELGANVHVTYCPERIAQGYAIVELDRLPQIVSGFSDSGVEGASALFAKLTPRILTVGVEEAELAKLFLNSWRYIQFAIANQFYMIAESRGIDFSRVYSAMTTGYDRAGDFPPPGFAAGPCLLKDTMQLSTYDQNKFQLGHAAMLINEGLVNFIVDQLDRDYDLTTTTVGILGMAFKGDIDDTRDSLAFKLRKLLAFRGARVLASDALAAHEDFVPAEELITESDVVILGAPHSAYRELSIPPSKHVVDVWGFFERSHIEATAS